MYVVSRTYHRIDLILFGLALALSSIGLVFVFSATYTTVQPFSSYFTKQAFGMVGGIAIFWMTALADRHALFKWGYLTYFLVVGLLIFTLIKGHVGMGAQRWLDLAFFRLQPSELAKPLFPVFATFYLASYRDTLAFSLYNVVPVLGMLMVSFVLILRQPDLGTALIIGIVGLILLWLAGMPQRWFLYIGMLGVLVAPIGWYMLKPYQKQRVVVFLGGGQAKKDRYQIEQSLIAIGSGGLCGKGLFRGTQNKLRFLPESRTDFIFAVLCEECGFIGAISVLLMYVLLIGYALCAVTRCQNPCDQLLAVGLLLHLILSIIINISMVLGLLPIVGIPLPFMSYGLSNLWVTWGSLGWFCNITAKRILI